MNGGLINCECGQEFYCETVNGKINCIRCGKHHEVYPFPEQEKIEAEFFEEELPLEEGE